MFPIDEAAIKSIFQLKNKIPEKIKLVMANERAIKKCFDKPAMFELCDTIGVPSHSFLVTDENTNLISALAEIGVPCIIKPVFEETIWFGKKAAIVRRFDDVNELSIKIESDNRRLMVQKYATGPRHNVYFAAMNGALLCSAEVLIERTDRTDGTGLAVSGRTIDATEALTKDTAALVSALNYSGVGCAQFLVDAQKGTRCFLELNPRLGANFAAVHHAGLPLAELAMQIALGQDCRETNGYRKGMKFAWTFGDLAGCRFELIRKNLNPLQAAKRLFRCGLDALFCDAHITMSWQDPRPTILEFYRAFTGRSKSNGR